jgi:hypothetical protein
MTAYSRPVSLVTRARGGHPKMRTGGEWASMNTLDHGIVPLFRVHMHPPNRYIDI